jgi:hypothetical protein
MAQPTQSFENRADGAGPRDPAGDLGEFTVNQMCSLRFASDAELPGLARKVLAENWTIGKGSSR